MLWALVLVMFGVGAGIIIQDGAFEQSGVTTILGREVGPRPKLAATWKSDVAFICFFLTGSVSFLFLPKWSKKTILTT